MRNAELSFAHDQRVPFRIPHSRFRIKRIMLDPRLLFVAVVWAVNFAFVKYALADFSPLSFTTARFALSSLFLALVMLIGRERFGLERRDIWPVIRLGFIGITVYNLLFMYGLNIRPHRTPPFSFPPRRSLPNLSSPFLKSSRWHSSHCRRASALNARRFFDHPEQGRKASRSRARTWPETSLRSAAALFWALYTIQARPLVQKYSPIKVTAYSMAAGTLMLLPIGPRTSSSALDTLSGSVPGLPSVFRPSSRAAWPSPCGTRV